MQLETGAGCATSSILMKLERAMAEMTPEPGKAYVLLSYALNLKSVRASEVPKLGGLCLEMLFLMRVPTRMLEISVVEQGYIDLWGHFSLA